jgi:hypothetical protein
MHDADRLRERALALPVVCMVLFSPPLLTMLGQPVSVAGVPLSYLYVFGAWLLLILIGRRLAKRLRPAVEPGVADRPSGASGGTGTGDED